MADTMILYAVRLIVNGEVMSCVYVYSSSPDEAWRRVRLTLLSHVATSTTTDWRWEAQEVGRRTDP